MFYEGVACVWHTIGTIILVFQFFMAIGFSMGVTTVSYALPIVSYKSFWNSQKG